MKKVITTILALTMIFTTAALTGCKKESKNPAVTEIMTSLRSGVEFPEMADVPTDQLNMYYELNAEKIAESACIIAGGGNTTDEVLIVKVKEQADAAAVKTAMETRLATQTDLFTTYNPEEVPKLKSAVIAEKGNYIFFAITNDNAKAKKIFNDAV